MGGERVDQSKGKAGRGGNSILGSLKDALAAAGRDDTNKADAGERVPVTAAMKDVTNALPPQPPEHAAASPKPSVQAAQSAPQAAQSGQTYKRAADAARDARGGTPNIPDLEPLADAVPPTTGVVHNARADTAGQQAATLSAAQVAGSAASAAATRFIRGRQKVSRGDFAQDPVVGWLVIVGGPGLGAFRPIFEGNNTVGRGPKNRIPIDFGDESISNDEQAYIRYDPADRTFLLVPNLSKTNVIAHNENRPAQPVPLASMDLISMGRTQLVFVPFCGPDFDWAELSELNR